MHIVTSIKKKNCGFILLCNADIYNDELQQCSCMPEEGVSVRSRMSVDPHFVIHFIFVIYLRLDNDAYGF